MGNYCFRDDYSVKRESLIPEKHTQNAQPLDINNGKLNKTNLKDFDSLNVLGQGAYGKVLLVKHIETGKLYAMKMLKKSDITKDSKVRHINDERLILEMVDHKFLVKLRFAFQTPSKLFLIVDYMSGGELFYHLRREKRFESNLIIFYAAEMAIGIGYLHSQNIIYRDLKPENVLVDEEGHIRLADFGLSKMCYNNQDKVYTMCGTPEYIAPEVLRAAGYDKVCDWWSYGCLIYEMFVGYPPFFSKDKKQMLKNRFQKPIPYPDSLSPIAKHFLQGLLQIDPKKRLGYKGVQEIKESLFFQSLDWVEIENKSVPPPYNFDKNGFKYFDKNIIQMNPHSGLNQTEGTQMKEEVNFTNFTYEQQVDALNKSQLPVFLRTQ